MPCRGVCVCVFVPLVWLCPIVVCPDSCGQSGGGNEFIFHFSSSWHTGSGGGNVFAPSPNYCHSSRACACIIHIPSGASTCYAAH
uniref:Putative secreted protein n=1 Tax=Anopheles darlingi TaxID=43151 RepID=A0A2M4DCQ8_ANODA